MDRVFYRRVKGLFVCFLDKQAHVAQLVERILGKDEVSSSNLLMGSICPYLCKIN